jgi:tRNA pseudouridine65 synthase
MRAEPPAMQILYLDSHLVAVDKPAGLLVHRSAIDRHETRYALQQARDLIGRKVYPVHRLDKPTAGVLLFALSPQLARAMTEQFAAGAVGKRYLAVVRGHVADAGVIDHPLREEPDAMTDRRASRDKAAQPAVTEYRCLARAELPYGAGRYATSRFSLVQALPRTGRKHQIRRHMKHIFHPIVGDTTHGDGRQNALFRARLGCSRLLLAATGMSFAHPVTQRRVDIAAPLDADFLRVLEALGWRDALPSGERARNIAEIQAA